MEPLTTAAFCWRRKISTGCYKICTTLSWPKRKQRIKNHVNILMLILSQVMFISRNANWWAVNTQASILHNSRQYYICYTSFESSPQKFICRVPYMNHAALLSVMICMIRTSHHWKLEWLEIMRLPEIMMASWRENTFRINGIDEERPP